MKKLLLIFILFVISCAGSPNKESAPETDSAKLEFVSDTVLLIATEPIAKSIEDPIPVILSETISIKRDTIIKKIVEKRAMNITKLDTTSYIPELKANVEKINYQQKQLDSLLNKRKK